jgi:hypothetical protein
MFPADKTVKHKEPDSAMQSEADISEETYALAIECVDGQLATRIESMGGGEGGGRGSRFFGSGTRKCWRRKEGKGRVVGSKMFKWVCAKGIVGGGT